MRVALGSHPFSFEILLWVSVKQWFQCVRATPFSPGLHPILHRIALLKSACFPPTTPFLKSTQAPVQTAFTSGSVLGTETPSVSSFVTVFFMQESSHFFFQKQWLIDERNKWISECPNPGGREQKKASDFKSRSLPHSVNYAKGHDLAGLGFSFMERRDCSPLSMHQLKHSVTR